MRLQDGPCEPVVPVGGFRCVAGVKAAEVSGGAGHEEVEVRRGGMLAAEVHRGAVA